MLSSIGRASGWKRISELPRVPSAAEADQADPLDPAVEWVQELVGMAIPDGVPSARDLPYLDTEVAQLGSVVG